MVYAFGCSFTKWFWPTWADWLQKYTNEQVINLGWPGIANETIYWELFARKEYISSKDTVYIMLTGNNRTCTWYDDDWITKNDCKGFFPRQDGKLECSDKQWHGLYRTTTDPSITQMVISNFNIVYQIQNILKDIGCKYTMMFWQNPWHDTRPSTIPEFKLAWPTLTNLSKDDIKRAHTITKLRPVNALLSNIDWSKFKGMNNFDIHDYNSYSGLWEYNLENIKQNLSLLHTVDPHPNSYIQHQFLTDTILEVDSVYSETARNIASELKNCDVSYEYSFLIPNSLEETIYYV
jgi:hypothetical protein